MPVWTPELIAWVTKAASSGWSSRQIARETGVSRNAIIGKLYRLNVPLLGGQNEAIRYCALPAVPSHGLTWATMDRAARVTYLTEGIAAGKDSTQIAKELQAVSYQAVISYANKRGLRFKSQSGAVAKQRKALNPTAIALRRDMPPVLHRVPLPNIVSAALPASRNVTLIELGPRDCRYMAGDPRHDGTFCGHPKRDGSRYCPAHHRLCYQPAEKKVKLTRSDAYA